MKKFFLIDAMAMAFRNYHAFAQRQLQTSTGLFTSAVYGSAQFMLKLISEEKPDFIVVATDTKDKTFRHLMYDKYKANRKDMPADLASQLPHFFELFEAMGIKVIKQSGVEADDLIGSLVTQFGKDDVHCYIVSGDKDFMQLVNPNVSLYAPKKAEQASVVGNAGVREKFGCDPHQVIDILALIGDSSDNVPGVRGIGDKGAAKLIHDFGTLENIYMNIDQIANPRLKTALTESKDMAFLSRQLVTIKTDIPCEFGLTDFEIDRQKATVNESLLRLFQTLEFRGLVTKLSDQLSKQSVTPNQAADQPSIQTSIQNTSSQNVSVQTIFSPPTPTSDTDLKNTISYTKLNKDYLVVNTPEAFTQFLQDIAQATTFSFDTETTGLNPVLDTPIGLSISMRSGSAWYIPLIAKHLTGWLTPDFIITSLKEILESPKATKIAHNLKFDLQMLTNINVRVAPPFGDTMLASYVLNPYSREHGLDSCAMEYLNFKKITTKQLMGHAYGTSMSDVDLDILAAYACEDADIVFRLNEIYQDRLKQEHLTHVYHDIEVPLASILAKMEQAGIYVNNEALADISEKFDKRAKDLEAQIYQLAGESFNINSPKQLQVILFEKLAIHTSLGLTKLKKTKSGFSTDVTVLESMSEHPLPRALLEYRSITKLKSTYVDALPQLTNPKTNRIHTSFHQTGTTTGRLSSSAPNLQNIPIRTADGREIRRAFCVSDPSHVIISADYSQIELRLLAHIANDEGLAAAFKSGEDIHTATAMRIFGVTADQVTADLRSNAKAINFGIIYGMGPQRLARDTGVSMAEAKSFIERYFASYPRIRNYIEHAKAEARRLGYSTTLSGRRRPIPELTSKERAVAVNGENIAVNSPIQGSAADLIKLAMIAIQKRLDASNLHAKMLLQVHDELVFECPKAESSTIIELVKDCMEHAMTLSVPLKVEVGQGKNWLEAH